MATLTTSAANRVLDFVRNKAAVTASVYCALLRITATASGGLAGSPRSTAVTVGQTTIPATPNGRMYRCTTAGTTGSGEPTWPTTNGGTVTDGGAVWTEMTPDFLAANASATGTEATYTGYARVSTAASDWSSAASASSASATVRTFPTCTGGSNLIVGSAEFDASTSGNMTVFQIASAASGVVAVSTNIAPTIPAGSDTLTLG